MMTRWRVIGLQYNRPSTSKRLFEMVPRKMMFYQKKDSIDFSFNAKSSYVPFLALISPCVIRGSNPRRNSFSFSYH